jgi:hypothetical protein
MIPARFAVASAVAGSLLTVGLISVPANAETAQRAGETFTKNYTLVKEFKSKPLKRCVRVTLWGSITFTRTQSSEFLELIYKNIKLNNPTVRVSALAKCGSKKTSTLTKVKIVQRWYESTCKAEVKVSAGYPWAISAEPTFECGRHRVGSRGSTYTGTHKTFTQYNSGRPLTFTGTLHAGKTVRNPPVPLCLSVRPTFTVYVKNKSDSSTSTLKACVKPPA